MILYLLAKVAICVLLGVLVGMRAIPGTRPPSVPVFSRRLRDLLAGRLP